MDSSFDAGTPGASAAGKLSLLLHLGTQVPCDPGRKLATELYVGGCATAAYDLRLPVAWSRAQCSFARVLQIPAADTRNYWDNFVAPGFRTARSNACRHFVLDISRTLVSIR